MVELVKICSEFTEEELLYNLVSAGEFAALTDEITDETSARVVNSFKKVLATFDTFVTEKNKDAKGIRDQLLAPNSIMFLLLAEFLVRIINFCGFLQTGNLN